MSSSHHDDHPSTEQKPVAFTVPLILASVLVLIIILFLSLCDPKPHHGHEAHDGKMEHAAGAHHEAATNGHEGAEANKLTEPEDSASVETEMPAAEPAHH